MPITDSKDSAEKEENPAPQNIQSGVPYPQQFEDGTIDFYELWNTFWNKKWLVIAVTVIAALGSVVYVQLHSSVYYRTNALLLPPKEKYVKYLNVRGLQNLKAEDILLVFNNNLSSLSMQRKFIEDKGMMDILAPEQDQEKRDKEISHIFANMSITSDNVVDRTRNNEKGMSKISISTEFNNPSNSAKWINAFIDFAESETHRMLMENVYNIMQEEIKRIKKHITLLREKEKKWREKRILEYEEAAQVAFKLGIKDRIDNRIDTPLYYRGFRALNVEIEFLKKREWDNPYSGNSFEEEEKRISMLQTLKFEEKGLHAIRIKIPAYQTDAIQHKINSKRIIVLGTLFGLFSGIFLVFFVSFVKKQKGIHSK